MMVPRLVLQAFVGAGLAAERPGQPARDFRRAETDEEEAVARVRDARGSRRGSERKRTATPGRRLLPKGVEGSPRAARVAAA